MVFFKFLCLFFGGSFCVSFYFEGGERVGVVGGIICIFNVLVLLLFRV